jgi:flagellar FliL protein
MLAAVLVLVLVGGGAAFMLLKKKPAEEGEDGEDAEVSEVAKPKAKPKSDHPPTFVPLDPFTVNLADKDVDRFAQIGITLEVHDPKFAEQIKAYMPAIRSNVLMVLSHKTASELLTREGKEKLAKEIMRESVRPMGIELDDEDEAPAGGEAPKKKKKKKAAVESPVTQVLFSNFIVQ